MKAKGVLALLVVAAVSGAQARQVRFSDAFDSISDAPALFEQISYSEIMALPFENVFEGAEEDDYNSSYDAGSFDENESFLLFSADDHLTHQNTFRNSFLKAKTFPKKLLKSLQDDHQQAARFYTKRMSQNGRFIDGAFDSLDLYKSGGGKKPKYPERRPHHPREPVAPSPSNHDNRALSGGNSRNSRGGEIGAAGSTPRNPVAGGTSTSTPSRTSNPSNNNPNGGERQTQQRIEEPPIEVIGHIRRKPLEFN